MEHAEVLTVQQHHKGTAPMLLRTLTGVDCRGAQWQTVGKSMETQI